MPTALLGKSLILAAVILFILFLSLHEIDEGHVGVYFRGGALLNTISEPGFHLLIPLITTYDSVQVILQTDKVQNIPCGTSGGVIIYFDQIEVVNQLNKSAAYDIIKQFTVDYDKILIFDKVHHEINQYCSVHTLQQVYIDLFDQIDEHLEKSLQDGINKISPGLSVHSVRVTKPKIPESVRKNYEQMESEKSKLLIAEQREKVVLKESETKGKKAVIDAHRDLEVSKIRNSLRVQEKLAAQQISLIANEMYRSRVQSEADAAYYSSTKQAASNEILLTIEYMLVKFYESLSNNSKIYFGNQLPNTLSYIGDAG